MGWTSYHADFYKKGAVDKKAECDSRINQDSFTILKSAMVGNTYYAAVKDKSSNNVFAIICLTSVSRKDYFNFAYKMMTEFDGPFKYDCPKGILDLLTPIPDAVANTWRKECYNNIAKKNNKQSLNKLPAGAKITFIMPMDSTRNSKGDTIILEKIKNPFTGRFYWYQEATNSRFTASLMKYIADIEYTVIEG